ncbi:hypothetical protein GCM10009692_09220 [Leucobacter aridicollis]
MRAKELDTLLAHVRARETVRLVGSQELGKTSLLGDLEASLAALGFDVLRIGADPALAPIKYGALRESWISSDRFHQNSSPVELTAILTSELARSSNSVLLIDDAEWLDVASAQALAPLMNRGIVSGVLASAPFRQLTTEQRATSRLIRADARVELQALSFEQVGVLSESILGAYVSPEIISEIFSMSSGITGIAADIIRAAQAANLIEPGADRWVSSQSRLWSVHLEETVERAFAHLSDDAFRLLHALSLAGSMPADRVHAYDPESTILLTHRGLVTMFRDPQGESRISPRPALITDFFRQRRVDVLHLSAVGLLDELSRIPAPPPLSAAATLTESLAARTAAQETHNAGLARYIREEAEQRLALAAQDWRRLPNPPHAIAYIDALLQAGGYQGTASEVIEHTPASSENAVEMLQLALHEQLLGAAGRRSSSRHTAALRAHHADFSPALDAYEMYVRFSSDGLTPEVRQWLDSPASDPVGFSQTVADYIHASTGRVHPLSDAPDSPARIPVQRLIADQTHLITVVRHSALDDSLERLLADPISLLPGDDPVPFLVDSYVRSQILLGLGRLSEARSTLSQALSVGNLDLRFAVLYAAMLRWSAFLHYRDGRTDIATSLLKESRGYPDLRGPMPGMRPEFGDALEVLFESGPRQASERFLVEAQACHDRSFVDASWAMARFAFQLNPTDAALDVLDTLGELQSYAWSTRLSTFARAALRQDPQIFNYISRLTTLSEISTAADFLEDIERVHRDRGTKIDPRYVEAVTEARQAFHMFQEPVAVRPRPEHVSAVESLTPRELEIAPLTATLSNREIADRLTLSIRTVENHIARSMKKLGLSSRKELSTALSSAAIAASGVGSD